MTPCPRCAAWQQHFNRAHAQRGAALADLAREQREYRDYRRSTAISVVGFYLVTALMGAYLLLCWGAEHL
jgi:hypothetical protein